MSKTKHQIRPETTDKCLCLEIGERVTLKDYQDLLFPAVKNHADKNGKINLVLVYGDEFLGWDLDAAAADLETFVTFKHLVEKIALVNPPEVVLYRWQTMGPLLNGEFRIYEGDCLEEAISWAKA